MNRTTVFALLLALIALVAVSAEGASESGAAARPAEEIVFAAPRDITPGRSFFHPTSVICSTWEPLVGTDADWSPVPVLAESWEMSPDGKQWTFRLRRGVRFHDGETFDADAVMANFDRYQKAPGKSRFYTFRMSRYYPFFEKIEKVDDYAVRLSFSQPMGTLPYYMVNWGSAMHSPKSFDENGEFITRPASTGPFKVVEHVMDQYAVLERFEDYWGERAKAERIRIKVIPDVNTRFSALRSEEIHSVMDIGAITPALADQLLQDDRFAVTTSKNTILHFVPVNGTKFPFDDVRMRRALSLAIDRELISKEFFHGYFPPTINILSYASPFHKEMPIPHDPAEARRLAAEVLGGRTPDVRILFSSGPQRYPHKEVSEYLQAVLGDLGLDAHIHVVERGAFRDTIKAGDYNLYVRIQGLPNAEALGILNDYMRTGGGQGMNPTTQNETYNYGYYNPEVEELLERAQKMVDLEKRAEIYHRIQEIAAEELPVIPILNEPVLFVYNKKIEDYEARVYGSTLTDVRWAR